MRKIISVFVALLMVLSVCSFALAEEETTLTFWFSTGVPSLEREKPMEEWTIMKIARQFEADHPGVKIDMVFQADQQLAQNKLRASVLAGDAPDIVNVYGFYFVTELQEVFLDITDLIPAEDKENIIGWDNSMINGRNYGYPVFNNEASIVLYNKDIAAEAGLDLEDADIPTNAEELWSVMERIKDTGKDVFVNADGGYNSVYVFGTSAFWTQMSGVDRITGDSLAEYKFSEDEGFLKSLKYTADMFEAGFIPADYESRKDARNRFINGEAAFMMSSVIDANVYDAFGDKLGIFMLPNFDDTVAYPNYVVGGAGQAACIMKTCENPELAVEFLSYLSNHDNSIALLGGRGLCLRKDVSAEELGYTGDALYEKYFQIVGEHSFVWNDNSLQGDVANEFYKLSTMATTGQISIEDCAVQLDQLAQDVKDNSEN